MLFVLFIINKYLTNYEHIIPIDKCCTLENYNNLNFSNIKNFMNQKYNYSLCDKKIFNFVKKNFKGNGALIGIWKGGLAIWLRYYLDKSNYLYLFDTFNEGFKYSNKFENYYYPSIDEVKNNFKKFGVDNINTLWFKGNIKNTILNLNKNINFSYIDVDLYEPTIYSLIGSYIFLNENGICAVDDYGVDFFDAKRAVDLFFKWYGIYEYNYINEYAIYWRKKPNNFKTDNLKLIYNFYCHYINKPSLNYELSSISILEMIYNYYKVPNKLIKFTQELQKEIGINNTVWGIKKEKNNDYVSWEYYYYGWGIDEPGSLINLFNNPRNINNFNKVYSKYFNKNILFDKELTDNIVIYSIDINISMFKDSENISDDIIHLYTNFDKTDKLIQTSKLKTFEYNYLTNEKKLESESETWIVSETSWNEIFKIIQTYGILSDFDIIKKFYEASRYFAIFIKHKKNKIGIYFHCIKFEYFILFLKMAQFKSDFIEYFITHEYYLNNISFEIAMDYDPILKEFVRFAFYGSV